MKPKTKMACSNISEEGLGKKASDFSKTPSTQKVSRARYSQKSKTENS